MIPPVDRVRSLSLDHRESYGAAFAEVYDRWYDDVTDAEATADFVATRTRSDLVIELGVGSGRLARPLIERGVTVVGLDSSAAMLDRCPSSVRRVQADMVALPFTSSGGDDIAPTVLCGFNTVFNLTTAEYQRELFRQLASVAGTVIIETLNAAILVDSAVRSTGVHRCRPGQVVVSSTVNDPVSQRLIGRHVELDDTQARVRPWMLRWATIGQLDAMADNAGFSCVERWGSWTGDSFQPDSRIAISVYEVARHR